MSIRQAVEQIAKKYNVQTELSDLLWGTAYAEDCTPAACELHHYLEQNRVSDDEIDAVLNELTDKGV